MEEFLQPEVNLAILNRPPPSCADALKELLGASHPCFDISVAGAEDLQDLPSRMRSALGLRAADGEVLYADVASLAGHFAHLTRAARVQIHLHKVLSDNCQFFHVDKVEARLLTTYAGLGTQWLRNQDVNRRALGRGKNSRIMLDGSEIQSVPTGAVAIMKGERWNSDGLVHRSPPMSRDSSARILLRIDLKR